MKDFAADELTALGRVVGLYDQIFEELRKMEAYPSRLKIGRDDVDLGSIGFNDDGVIVFAPGVNLVADDD